MSFSIPYLLTIITFLPLLGALVLLLIGSDGVKRTIALVTSLLTFLISLMLLVNWQDAYAGMQFEEMSVWIPQFDVYYHLGVDGISLFLVLLTTLLMPIVIVFSNMYVTDKIGMYLALMLALETAMIGVFVALDLLLFFVFFEFSLIPMYFLIGRWGGQNRVYAALKFFLYTFAGSALMLVAILAVYYASGTLDIEELLTTDLSESVQLWALVLMSLAFALAFSIKVPLFPFHTWLPDAHVQAPTAASVLLAAVLLKMGAYGYVRIFLPIFPTAAELAAPWLAGLAVISILYGGMVALAQKDVKSLVAYSSVAHLGFVMLGLVAWNLQGVSGAVLQMVNHGLSTGALFLIVGMLYERRHTRMLDDFGGLWKSVPILCGFFLVVAMSSAGLPGLNGFVGEFSILLGAYLYEPVFAVLAALGVILAAWYLLTAFRKIAQGPITRPENEAANLPDLKGREIAILLPLVLLFFIIGLFPNLFLDKINPSVQAMLDEQPAIVMEVER
ncbi:MAG: NADH-quinone oxidoreductase subunit M [Caldilineaceae bacterium]|nr:NADH-quinone oxidoreductase subunit M [Caldilineaceae bacterium]